MGIRLKENGHRIAAQGEKLKALSSKLQAQRNGLIETEGGWIKVKDRIYWILRSIDDFRIQFFSDFRIPVSKFRLLTSVF
jgi:hypothetical protein